MFQGIALCAVVLAAELALGATGQSADPLTGDWGSSCVPIGENGRHGAIFHVGFRPGGAMDARFDLFANPTALHRP